MAHVGRTRYTRCGEMDIAYQVLGDGACDLVALPAMLVPIDSIDAEPSMYRFHQRLASFSRLIRFDYRGTGLSSRFPAMDEIGLESWAADAIAVMDAVGCEQATVFGSGLPSMVGLVMAANYPERVRGLVIVNGAARLLWAPDYPVGAPVSQATTVTELAMDTDAMERGFDAFEFLAPTRMGDQAFRTWWDQAGNRGASPSVARALAAKVMRADVRDALARITARTLILHRDGCVFVPAGHGRYLAEHIASSRYIELPGVDTLYWVGDSAPLLDEIEEFITGVRGGFDADRVVATIVFTDIVDSTARAAALGDRRWHDLLDNHDRIVRHQLQRFGGREVNTAGDGFVATFINPSRAIDCAHALVDAVHVLGIEVRVGIHAGETEVRGTDIAGMAVHIAARVAALATPNMVLVSSTVREIVTGSQRIFHERGEHELKGVPGHWRLYTV